MELALGTAQFGSPYGVSNSHGIVSQASAYDILETARESGIEILDTAPAYGEAEAVLGDIGTHGFSVISKILVPKKMTARPQDYVRRSVTTTLSRLNTEKLSGLLVHNPEYLTQPHGWEIYQEMLRLRGEGLIDKVGVSVYSPSVFCRLAERFQFDLVQCPVNVLDRSSEQHSFQQRISESGAKLMARSAFLQGLLLQDLDKLPKYFDPWRDLLGGFENWAMENRMSKLEACLVYVKSAPGVDILAVGVETSSQLRSILSALEAPSVQVPSSLKSEDPNLTNPSRWKL